jgi:hypothetical protein
MPRPDSRMRHHRAALHRSSHELRSADRAGSAARMPRRQRAAVLIVLGFLWLSGCLWLVLDEFFAKPGQFGRTPHPWLMIHGIFALVTLYVLGWVTSRHIVRWWPGGLRRVSGGALTVFLALLVLSGFALFFVSDDRWQGVAATSHDILGLAVTVFAVQHWFFARRRVMRNAASRPW